MADLSIKVVADLEQLAAEAARRVEEAAAAAIRANGAFTIALSGGSTPKALYRTLAEEPYRSAIPWPKVEFFFGDERCVPPDHPDSNYRMVDEALFSRLPIPPGNIHRMHGEANPMAAADQYDALLQQRFDPDRGLDLVLLGMGGDGHTASLFPGTAALLETTRRCVANQVEQLGTWRLTLTAPFLNRCPNILILVAGANKAKRVHEVLEGPRDSVRLPIQLISPPNGQVTWLLEAAAAGMV